MEKTITLELIMEALDGQCMLTDSDMQFLYNYYREHGYLLFFTAFCSPLASTEYLQHTVVDGTPRRCLNRNCRVDHIISTLDSNAYIADFASTRDTDNHGTIATVVIGERLVYGVACRDFRDVYLEHLWKLYSILEQHEYYMPSICWEILPSVLCNFLSFKFMQLHRCESGVDVGVLMSCVNDTKSKLELATKAEDIVEDFDASVYSMFHDRIRHDMRAALAEFIDLRVEFDRDRFLNTELTPQESLAMWLSPAKLSAATKAIDRAVDWLKSLGFEIGGAKSAEVA